jgi:hypothetical protein
MNVVAASSGDAAGLSGTVAGGAVVVVVLAVVMVVVAAEDAAEDVDSTVGDGSLSELQPASSTNAHAPTATARYISPT